MSSSRADTMVRFDAAGITLEGAFSPGTGTHAAVITHPHPLYGGDMNNPVVAAIARAYASQKWGTLRFNFRQRTLL